jgi:hypothetical protein
MACLACRLMPVNHCFHAHLDAALVVVTLGSVALVLFAFHGLLHNTNNHPAAAAAAAAAALENIQSEASQAQTYMLLTDSTQ